MEARRSQVPALPCSLTPEGSQPFADGEFDEIGDAVQPQLVHGAATVGQSSLDAHAKARRDILRVDALCDKLKNLALPGRENRGPRSLRCRQVAGRPCGIFVWEQPEELSQESKEVLDLLARDDNNTGQDTE